MSFTLLDTATRAAVAAAASQQAQLTALLAPFGAGPITARLESDTGAHLRTLTLPLPSIEGTTPRRFTFGALLADAAVATGTPGRWVFRTSGGVSIFALSAGLSGAAVNHAGPVRTLCTPTLAGVTVTADAALPADSLPAWRTAMTATNTLYRVGQTPLESGIQSQWAWPSGIPPARWAPTVEDRVKWAGFGGGVFVPDAGPYGAYVFNETGEAVWQNNAKQWRVADGTLAVWTQPQYHTTSAAAIAAGDTVYYSPTDAANTAIVAASRNFATDTALLTQPWDQGYPFAISGWVFREKHAVGSMTLKGNQPHWFRYNTPRAVAASVAGTSRSIIVCKENNLHGPFAQAWKPSGYPDSAMTTDLWPSNRRRVYAVWQNTETGVWSRITSPVPDYTPLDAFSDHAVVDSVNRRLYYYVPRVGTYFLDLSAGIASATFSNITAVTGADIAPEFDRGNVVLTDGHPTGKRYLYFRPLGSGRGAGTANRVGMLDLDTNIVYELNLSTRGMDPGSNWSMQFGYDAASNRVLITTLGLDTTPRFHSFVVPTDPTVAANYTVSTTELAFASGVSMEAGFAHKPTGERGRYHADLGVIFITQEDEAVLAFRPVF